MIKDREAQASAVGVMLAILVVLTIISVITLHYVPMWMKEKEARHMDTVVNQFCDLQKAINNLIVSGNTTTDISASFSLGVEGLPILGVGATMGNLEVDPYASSFTLKNSSENWSINATGRLKFTSGNRYYSKQSFVYENSAVIVMQSEGDILKAAPELNIYNSSGIHVLLKLVSIQSTKKEVFGGSGIQTLKFKLLSSIYRKYSWDDENLTLNIRSECFDVWEDLLNTTLKGASLNETSDYNLTTYKDRNKVSLELYHVKMLGVRFTSVEASTY